jgi:hypothetical protein
MNIPSQIRRKRLSQGPVFSASLRDFYKYAALNSCACLLVVITMRGNSLEGDYSVLDGVLHQIGIGFKL